MAPPINNLTELRQFVAVAKTASFAAAARELKQTSAAVSAGIKKLEANLGVRLFERSTRSVRLTQEGTVFLSRSEALLNQIELAVDEVRGAQAELEGQIVVTAPSDLARTVLNRCIDAFCAQHPHIRIAVMVGDKVVDIQKQSIDVAIRFGEPKDSTLIARPLTRTPAANREVVCASPTYLAAHGTPQHPYDLKNHACLCFFVGGQLANHWRFEKQQQLFEVEVTPYRSADDSALCRQWAIEGKGIVRKSYLDVQTDIEANRLQPILTNFTGKYAPLYAIYPSKTSLPARTMAFIEHLLAYFDA